MDEARTTQQKGTKERKGKASGLYEFLVDREVLVTLLTGEKFMGKLTRASQYEITLVNSGGTTLIPKHAIKLVQMKTSF